MAKSLVLPLEKSLRALSDPKKQKECIHIKQLRFPCYRQLRRDERLEFEFPITALMGQNGTNKSSILHALYGSPRGKSIAEYWFGTKVDAIPEEKNGLKQSVTHTYIKGECIKARAPRDDDPDYWESVKPTGRYGFSSGATRVPPIDVEVTHLDFRGLLPAFDKYFYFPDPKHLAARRDHAKTTKRFKRREYRKQDYLRHRSSQLRKKLDKATHLTPNELKVISYVVERDYRTGVILEHDVFHGHEGTTVRFTTGDVEGGYSEAFAGSGESAVALLVNNLSNAPAGSLVLLDEPETSLHPRAQQRLLQYLADVSVKRKLQVVMATHSSYLTSGLPQAAIRVLLREPDGQIRISSEHTVDEALHEIGDLGPGRRVFVEDERAQQLLGAALLKHAPASVKEVAIRVAPGGTSRCYSDIVSHVRTQTPSAFFVLDGDHRPAVELPEVGQLPQGDSQLGKLIDQLTRGPNDGGPSAVLDGLDGADAKSRFIEYFRSRVRFLPATTPEALVWDKASAASILGVEKDELEQVDTKPEPKDRLVDAVALTPGMDADALYKGLVSRFLKREDTQAYKDLMGIVDDIRKAQQ